MSISNSAIRKQMIAARSALKPEQLHSAALGLARNARRFAPLMRATNIASFIPIRGEAPPYEVHRVMRAHNVCIPVICNLSAGLMKFCAADASLLSKPSSLYGPEVPRNGYGIPEPTLNSDPVQTRSLDVVLTPLAAFDRKGNRLGLGAGFYDRAFAYRLWNKQFIRPLLIGIAHEFQEVEGLDSQPWDVPLDVIITPNEVIRI